MLTVFGLGIVELWAAIPTGLALGLHPLATGIMAATGAISGALITLKLGERIRTWLAKRHSKNNKNRQHGRIYRIWSRYGVVGLGLLAPLLVGAPVGTALGVTFGVPGRNLLFWMSIGIILWSAGLTAASALGLLSIKALIH